jgi:hypothetical protein
VTETIAGERKVWEEEFGVLWVAALSRLREWAAVREIPIRAGSVELLESALLASWGWANGSSAHLSSGAAVRPGRGSWILRVPPGAGEIVRARIDEDASFDLAGAPSIRIEESLFAHLPIVSDRVLWPSPEAWIHAARLLSTAGVSLGRSVVPSNESALLAERDALVASDWRAVATAWERDRGAYWVARHSLGYATPLAREEWVRRAREWRLRVVPANANESWVLPTRPGGFVRLGLGEVVSSETARALCEERLANGKFRGAGALFRRALRAGISRAELRRVVVGGALAGWGSVPVLWARTFVEGPAVRRLWHGAHVVSTAWKAHTRPVGRGPAPLRSSQPLYLSSRLAPNLHVLSSARR